MTHSPEENHVVLASDGLLDLGAIKVPSLDGLEIRLIIEQETMRGTTVQFVYGSSMADVQVFARAKDELLWPQTRDGLVSGLQDQGVASEVSIGRFGSEVQCTMPAVDFEGQNILQSVRFIGIDGERWFMRIAISGSATFDPHELAAFDEFIAACEIVRGDEAMSPGEPLEFKPPQSLVDSAKTD